MLALDLKEEQFVILVQRRVAALPRAQVELPVVPGADESIVTDFHRAKGGQREIEVRADVDSGPWTAPPTAGRAPANDKAKLLNMHPNGAIRRNRADGYGGDPAG